MINLSKTELEKRIAKLSQLLSSCDAEEINKRYKESELENLSAYFSKYPEVRYSQEMKKRMARDIKRKKLSNARICYLQELIDSNSTFSDLQYKDEYEDQVNQFLNQLEAQNLTHEDIGTVLIEHSFEPNETYCQIYKHQAAGILSHELGRFITAIDFSSIWGFLNKHRFESLAEILEGVTIEDEEYPQIINEVFKLRSYKVIKNAIQDDKIRLRIQSVTGLHNIAIMIGEHDNWHYEIYRATLRPRTTTNFK